MNTSAQHNSGFNLVRRAASALCLFAFVALIASAIGVVSAVLVLTAPNRSALVLSPLPAVAWEMPR